VLIEKAARSAEFSVAAFRQAIHTGQQIRLQYKAEAQARP